jgi:hypothetical protein
VTRTRTATTTVCPLSPFAGALPVLDLVIDYNVTGPIKNNTVNYKHLPGIASEVITA